MRTTDDYVALIPSFHSTRPKFVATVGATVDPLARLQVALAALELAFDLDTAVGDQLDAVGVRVGRSRRVPYPIQGIYFSFDDDVRGLDRAVWYDGLHDGTAVTVLDDDTFRRLLRAKILINRWDGTVAGEEAIVAAYFTGMGSKVFVSDDAISSVADSYFAFDDAARGLDQGVWAPLPLPPLSLLPVDMRITIGVSGAIPSLQDLAVLAQGLVVAKPEGVTVDYAVTSNDGAPVFGFDLDNDYVGGLDHGAWGVTPGYLLLNPPA